MSEEKAKHIHIEDGNAEAEEAAAEKAEAKAEEVAEEVKSEETAAEEAGNGAEESTEKAEADEKTAEEQESERYMRLMAEFQNFKRRAAKEKSDIHAFANERIVNDLLPVLDNFERALGTKTEDVEYAKGMDLIFQQLKTALDKAGLKEIEASEGTEFDPSFHNAVMAQPSTTVEDGKISMVMQKGYTLNGKVIRPSMVAVAKNE